MDERRDIPAPAGSSRQPIVAAASELSPVQQAWGEYATHYQSCKTCPDVDAGPCPTAESLYGAWRGLASEACQQIADLGR
jgi:hypothetical protein